jgi:conjugal transfer mating pair stabilization protein TraN
MNYFSSFTYIIISITLLFTNYALADCIKKAEVCIEGPLTKTIQGFEASRDCWKYKTTYDCTSEVEASCDNLRESGCYEIESKCIENIGDKCVKSKKQFHCERYERSLVEEDRIRFKDVGIKQGDKEIPCKTEIPCIDGSCADQSYQNNNEMLSSISQLQIFKELQSQLEDGLNIIFKGEDSRCGKALAGWKDCCVKGNGWGTKVRFDSCKAEDLATAKKTAAGLCYEVGSYCAKKTFKICRVKKKSFCCFSSKLIRMIHEQGRRQLGIGWGDRKSPNCQGLTPDQLAQIDFSKLNLSEVYHDIVSKYKKPDISQIKKDIQQELNIAVENFKRKGEESNASVIKKDAKEGL